MARKVIDCRDFPAKDINCTLAISGEEEEVVTAAMAHAKAVHGYSDTPEVREKIKSSLKDETELGGQQYKKAI